MTVEALAAHQPFERFPALIKRAAREDGTVAADAEAGALACM